MNSSINIVIPLFNEEEVFNNLITRLNKLMESTSVDLSVILVDDGSTDSTPILMEKLVQEDERYCSVFLSRNFGHQLALSAGLSVADATEGVFILDGDLQDPPELFDEFYSYLTNGYDVIYGVRKKRKENIFKRVAYNYFYRLNSKISMIDMPIDSGDFSLISKRVVELLNSFPESSRFIRGLRSWVGFKQIGIEYEREARLEGKSKYSLKQLLKLAINGIFNFSEFPIKLITRIGATILLTCIVYFLIIVIKKISGGNVPAGYTSLIFVIITLSSIQLLALGIIGEYILRIFFQVKKRPLFIIKKISGKKNDNTEKNSKITMF